MGLAWVVSVCFSWGSHRMAEMLAHRHHPKWADSGGWGAVVVALRVQRGSEFASCDMKTPLRTDSCITCVTLTRLCTLSLTLPHPQSGISMTQVCTAQEILQGSNALSLRGSLSGKYIHNKYWLHHPLFSSKFIDGSLSNNHTLTQKYGLLWVCFLYASVLPLKPPSPYIYEMIHNNPGL